MGQRTTKLATIYAGNAIELYIIIDHSADDSKRFKLYKKWYQYNNETDFGYHRKKVNDFDNYGDALQYATHIITGFIKI